MVFIRKISLKLPYKFLIRYEQVADFLFIIEIENKRKEGDSMEYAELRSCIVKTFRCSEQIAAKVIESSEKRGELEAIKKMVSSNVPNKDK